MLQWHTIDRDVGWSPRSPLPPMQAMLCCWIITCPTSADNDGSAFVSAHIFSVLLRRSVLSHMCHVAVPARDSIYYTLLLVWGNWILRVHQMLKHPVGLEASQYL